MRHGRDPVLLEQAAQLLVVERLPVPAGEHQWTDFPASNSPLTEEKGGGGIRPTETKSHAVKSRPVLGTFPYTRAREIQ